MSDPDHLKVKGAALGVESSAVDADNPWPGLASFTEAGRDFFFGREKETEELVRLVHRNTLTVLFGQSGLGKSSLLHAGVFPLLREADFFVPMLPYSSAVRHIVAAPELALLKPGAHVINIARGGIVDDDALIAALRSGRIAGAGLDVYENEPALDRRYFELDNVVLTPHIGSASTATRLSMAMLAVDNLVAALSGQTPPNPVEPATRVRVRHQ